METGKARRSLSERRKTRRREKERRRDAAEEREAEEEVPRDQHCGRKQKKHRPKIRESRFEPPTAAYQTYHPPTFACPCGITMLVEEVSNKEHVAEHVEELERIAPEESDTSSELDSDSDTSANPEEEEPQMREYVPVQSPVHHKFGSSERWLSTLNQTSDPTPSLVFSDVRRGHLHCPLPFWTQMRARAELLPAERPASLQLQYPTKVSGPTREPTSEPCHLFRLAKLVRGIPIRLGVQLADHPRNLRSGRMLGSREATREDLDEPHFLKIRPLRFPAPVMAITGAVDISKSLTRRTNAERRLLRPSRTEEMIMSDDGVEEERRK